LIVTGSDKLISKIELFESCGISAGVVLKGDWKEQSEIYDSVRSQFPERAMKLIVPRQVHGTELVEIDSKSTEEFPIADGVYSDQNGICLTVRTADCIPLLFVDPKSGYFGAIHIGWRGEVSGIVERLFIFLQSRNISLADINIYMGPSIGPCCFEVGEEVAVLFEDPYLEVKGDKYHVDLVSIVRNKLSAGGVNEANMEIAPGCTFCEKDKYYSYRRLGSAPKQLVSYIFRDN